jgi:riboflavin kinase/FMN adenylyltransferase
MDPVCFYDQKVMRGIKAVALGVFDGVHRGHRKIFETLLHGETPDAVAVATFEPHPMRVIAPEREPRRLMTMEQKIAAIKACGVSHVIVWSFDVEIRELSPEDFVVRLAEIFPDLQRLVVGKDWRFGFNATGDASLLAVLGKKQGWRVVEVDPILESQGVRISSTRIRELVELGNIKEAERLLGGCFCLQGVVVHGDGRGMKMGFPTLNVRFDYAQCPPMGVYGAKASVRGREYLCVVNIGVRPTVREGVESGEPVFEAHLLDYNGESLYGDRVEFWDFIRIRDEVKFPNMDALRAQIAQDVAWARESLKSRIREECGGGVVLGN